MPDAQDADNITRVIEDVQAEIPRVSSRNDQFAKLSLGAAAHEGVVFQDCSGVNHPFEHAGRRIRRLLGEEFRQPLEVGKRLGREDYLRHFTGLGRFTFSPRAFARTYARTSSAA